MGDKKHKRTCKSPTAETIGTQTTSITSSPAAVETDLPSHSHSRRAAAKLEAPPILSPSKRTDANGAVIETTPAAASVMCMDAVVKEFCTHTVYGACAGSGAQLWVHYENWCGIGKPWKYIGFFYWARGV